MEKTVIIIDDQKDQAVGLSVALQKALPSGNFIPLFEADEILRGVDNLYYSLAIVDIRMDKFPFDGIKIMKRIFEVNPFAKVIVVSAFKDEYFIKLKEIMLSGKVLDVIDKEPFATWIPKLSKIVGDYFLQIDADPSEINKALLQFYSTTKNEKDTYKKGEKFEHFISLLFGSFGYKDIKNRVKDVSLNEVDLIVRNEIDDSFLSKFGKYILIECKNKPDDGVNKNDFIVFSSKLKHTNGLAELGIVATSGYITKNTYHEAIRGSADVRKILFLSNPEILNIINAYDKKEEFKRIIDEQVKDN